MTKQQSELIPAFHIDLATYQRDPILSEKTQAETWSTVLITLLTGP